MNPEVRRGPGGEVSKPGRPEPPPPSGTPSHLGYSPPPDPVTASIGTMDEPTDGTFQMLRELAQNLWWSWQPDIRAIFRELEPEMWSTVYHNPVALLQRVPPEEIYRRVQNLEMQTRIN